MSKFDPTDFSANPKKYELFKTAIVARNVYTHNGAHDLVEGLCVGLRYERTGFNTLWRRDEPVYEIVGKDCTLWANHLRDFVL